jgi:hypothetical protein
VEERVRGDRRVAGGPGGGGERAGENVEARRNWEASWVGMVGAPAVTAVVAVTAASLDTTYCPCVTSWVFWMTARNGATVRDVLLLRVSSPIVPAGPARTPETPCTPAAAERNAAPAERRRFLPESTCPAAPSA